MRTTEIDLVAFSPDHLEGALALSRQASWPHRLEDWRMALALSVGFVALAAGRVVGTALVTQYGSDYATVNMIIVDQAMRGLGLGRQLMDRAMHAVAGRRCRLIATAEGLPLYQKLGFQPVGTILQHQGVVGALEPPRGVDRAGPGDLPAIAALDRTAFGANRQGLIAYLDKVGRFAVFRRQGVITSFAALRLFGRGEVIGPVIAGSEAEARDLIAYHMADRPGAFLRVDTGSQTGLSSWLVAQGLVQVGGGVAMRRGEDSEDLESGAKVFALASQALG